MNKLLVVFLVSVLFLVGCNQKNSNINNDIIRDSVNYVKFLNEQIESKEKISFDYAIKREEEISYYKAKYQNDNNLTEDERKLVEMVLDLNYSFLEYYAAKIQGDRKEMEKFLNNYFQKYKFLQTEYGID